MKNCLICNSEIQGRSNKKYCSVSCKSIAQQERRHSQEKFYFKVDRQLKINRKMLKKYNLSGFTTLRRDVLAEEGFNPNFFTHYWKNKKGKFICLLMILEYLKLNIIRRENKGTVSKFRLS